VLREWKSRTIDRVNPFGCKRAIDAFDSDRRMWTAVASEAATTPLDGGSRVARGYDR
jgi:hypothetical protein